MSGRLFFVVGPSGAGKDTLLQGACAACPDLHVMQRVITRAADAGGETHEALSTEAFLALQAQGELALSWQANGLHYGIRKDLFTRLAQGQTVVVNGSRRALPQMLTTCPQAQVIWVTADAQTLNQRLLARARESAQEQAQRAQHHAMPPPDGARVVLNNGSVAQGVSALLRAMNLAPLG